MGAIAAGYLAVHLPSLAPTLEDYDSINFALGLRDFDPARHQPHPPGSPVYIVLGRALLAVISTVWPALPRPEAEALTLALWSAIAGAVALVALAHIFAAVSSHRATVIWATAVVAASPLFWMSGLRPMSDLPGLAAALVAQALILQGRTERVRLVLGALLAGLAIGLRVQTAWLTVPLLALAVFEQRRAGIRWLVSRPFAALAAGVLVWVIPLVVDSGGVDGYLRALRSQAGEDFAWVNMLWLEPTPRRLAFALYETFVLPWGSNALAGAMAMAAAVGLFLTLARERRSLAVLLVAFAPYVVFHLLFQETIMVRYALPALPLVVWFAARGAGAAARLAPVGTGALVAWALAVAVPAGVAYGRAPHPAFQAIVDASRYAGIAPPAAVYAHHSLWRALQADGRALPLVEPPRSFEWLGPVSYWKGGGNMPIWFFADPRRTDLALVDPSARADVVHYPWAVAGRPELSGARPTGTDWYRIGPPGWFAEEGWSLTPETGGLARATAAGPDHRPIVAWVRRRAGPLHLVVGGRHLGEAGDPAAQFELALDGAVRDRWDLTVEQRNFLRFLDIPSGLAAGDGAYSRLTIVSRTLGGDGRRAPVGVRQFDFQPASRLLYGFAEGWHEQEYDVVTGQQWRWTSERSIVRVQGPSGAVAVTLRGESPLRYFDSAPTVRVTAGGRVVGQFRPDDDFEWTVTIPAADVERSGGAIAIETDRVYLPAAAEGTADERHLGLRLYECRVFLHRID
ncbi:MAG: hypothetical protein ACRD3C_03595 [Vicinamibacterales bacterium]